MPMHGAWDYAYAQATTTVGLHNGFIHRCHRSANYDAYDIGPPESSYGATDPAYGPAMDFRFSNGLARPMPLVTRGFISNYLTSGVTTFPELAQRTTKSLEHTSKWSD
jgi:hypothetical protein